jgi:predicted SAM-dependent methyltransferase
MEKVNYLNVGCGNKFHRAWVNVDMVSNSEYVMAVNLLKGIPFPSDHFEVVYHSQVLEHIPKEKAHDFIRECYRVLKPGGILRVVLPNLENIVDEYKRLLQENLERPTAVSAANYDWMMLEMYDQTVRNHSGGQMAAYLRQPNIVNKEFIVGRIGYVGESLLDEEQDEVKASGQRKNSALSRLRNLPGNLVRRVMNKIAPPSETEKIGRFRLGGEIHMWMYDRYSLKKLLQECGFEDISVKSPYESDIPDWSRYQLDVKDGKVYDPTSLFMEARKKR